LKSLILDVDIYTECLPLNVTKREALRDALEKVAMLPIDEGSKWAQHENVKHIQEEGNDTKYFHLIAN
jgi:hypothetical protein